MKLAVVGLGKIGLPIAMQACSKGVEVTGCDINQRVVENLNRGINHIKEEPGIDEKLKDALEKGLFRATTETSKAVSESDVVIIVVPLVVDKEKNVDYRIIDAATRDVARGLRKGTLVIYETTLPVGDTRNHMKPLLEEGSGLKAPADFYLAFSPERVYTGQVFRNLSEYPKIVGGIDEESAKKAEEFYRRILDAEIIRVANSETAEMVKIMGMTYRDVNIALANEFAKFAQKKGIDIKEAIEACNTNPHSHVLRPGIGVGGHCAPVYPYFIINEGKRIGSRITLAEEARKINDEMAKYATGLLAKELGGLKEKRVLILGLAFRENVKETAFTTTRFIIDNLLEEGARVLLHDPLFSKEEIEEWAPFCEMGKDKIDAAIMQAYHREYQDMDFGVLKKMGCKVFLDGRNMVPREKAERAGIRYIGMGIN
ncbi:nucleotide sugar dehydrogenase [Candidatus Woesearchaeota archaeon]|nr:MAG: nucleotide sugar dehydrogenase [Candidatus Woesearchaeota archaeon]